MKYLNEALEGSHSNTFVISRSIYQLEFSLGNRSHNFAFLVISNNFGLDGVLQSYVIESLKWASFL
jgi:hypothetical protein